VARHVAGVLTTVYVATMSVVGENLAERLRYACRGQGNPWPSVR